MHIKWKLTHFKARRNGADKRYSPALGASSRKETKFVLCESSALCYQVKSTAYRRVPGVLYLRVRIQHHEGFSRGQKNARKKEDGKTLSEWKGSCIRKQVPLMRSKPAHREPWNHRKSKLPPQEHRSPTHSTSKSKEESDLGIN